MKPQDLAQPCRVCGAPAIESGVRGVAPGLAVPRLDRSRLAILGNGVVPVDAAHAWLALRARLEAR